jgi:hypothetical protein
MNRFRCKQVESVAVLGFNKLAKTFFTDAVEKSSPIFEPLFTKKSEIKAATVPARAAASRQDFRAVAYPRFPLCSSAASSVGKWGPKEFRLASMGWLLFTSQQAKLIRAEARRRMNLQTGTPKEQRLATVDPRAEPKVFPQSD